MPIVQSLPWTDPLALAAGIRQSHWMLLYSGVQASYSGRYSLLAYDLSEKLEGRDFSEISQRLSVTQAQFDNAWFGYLGYGLKDALENLPQDQPGQLALPELLLMQFHTIYVFDHALRKIIVWSDQAKPQLLAPAEQEKASPIEITGLYSNMSAEAYLKKAAHIIHCIHAGDLYQANLTRKFGGHFKAKPHAFSLFESLCRISPAPYSAYIRLGDTHILSSSPEQFLSIGADGKVMTRPIKGTSARFPDPLQDEASRKALSDSTKDRAENLMIVDLMRNDLARSCLPGSIKAEPLFEVTSHAQVHHLSSTVMGQKRPGVATIDIIKSCFPPGSMTGAPKIKAMKLCTELEQQKRGVYSGAIGWLGGDGGAELSVVIRTLLISGTQFEFQVGGGIVADSTPKRELQEIFDKASGILKTLGLTAADLRRL
jgi:para-aminobenzoate synthetase component I